MPELQADLLYSCSKCPTLGQEIMLKCLTNTPGEGEMDGLGNDRAITTTFPLNKQLNQSKAQN